MGARLCVNRYGSMGFWGEAHASVSHIGETGQTLHGHTYAAVKMAREDEKKIQDVQEDCRNFRV